METVVPYAIWAALIIAALSILAIVLFGARSLTYGKVNLLTGVMLAIPVVLVLALGLTAFSWAKAAILTAIIMFGLGVLGLLATGVRGLFTS